MNASSALRLDLETPLPASLPAGRGTALFLFGTAFHAEREVRALEIVVAGVAHPATCWGMPRFDLFASLHPGLGTGERPLPATDPSSSEDPEINCYRSGFWATVPAYAGAGPILVEVRARLDDGTEAVAAAGTIAVEGRRPEAEAGGPDGTIAVCMSTYDPDPDLLRIQLDSLREQTDRDWICLISDDCSAPGRYREIEEQIGDDPRFVLSRSERRLGFYRGFERALGAVPAGVSLVALCDQDDRWYAEKLATLRSEIGAATLVYSDQRLVDPAGTVLADTYWGTRANNHTDLVSLLIANTITGAASLMRREVVERALPFPEVPGEQYHDHWLGLVAMTLGDVAYVDRPLYDYVQHGAATLGHAAANAGLPAGPGWRESLNPAHLRRLLGDGRGAYFFAYARLAVLAETLLARCGDEAVRSKRRALGRFSRAERRPLLGVPWLAARMLRGPLGRNETLGVERLLIQGIAWRYALSARARGVRRPRGWTYDASMPPLGASAASSVHREPETAHIQRIIAPLELAVSEAEPERINVLIPSIDLRHLFGGYIAKFNLASSLAASGRRVRIVTVDPTPRLPADWRARVEAYSGLAGAFDRVEVAFGREGGALAVNPDDAFVATTWWTAYVARAAVARTRRERFLYLIQEYEPFTFEMGSMAALAMRTYEFPHLALFSTELLRKFFREHGYGVYAAGRETGERDSVPFQNAITPVVAPSAAELAGRSSRRLLFYARSEQHARRNMFELGLIALSQAIEAGAFGPGWEFFGVGSVSGRSRVPLPGGTELVVLPRLEQSGYGEMLVRHDVGLALMFTPHPSLVPLEMASAGMLTVTNTYDTKTAAEIEAISANLIASEPSIEGVVAGLGQAAERVGRHEERVAGATVGWSTDWRDSFGPDVITEIESLLDRC